MKGTDENITVCIFRTIFDYSGTSIERRAKGLAKFVREVSLYRGSIHIFYYYWSKENRSFYRGLRFIEVRYIEVPL